MCRFPGAEIIGDTPAPAYCAGSMARFTPVVAAAWADAVPGSPTVQGAVRPTTILTRGFRVKVIARIPALGPAAGDRRFSVETTTAVDATAGPATVASSTARSRPRRRGPRSRFPVASVTVLAIMAACAWSLASWNESRRIERARADRIARTQGLEAAPGTRAR